MSLNIKRTFGILTLFSLLMLLIACEEANYTVDAGEMTTSETDVDLSAYPIGIQKGNISVEYFDILTEHSDETGKLAKKTASIKGDVGVLDDNQKKQIVQAYEDFLVYLNGIHYVPQNEIEQEIDNYFKPVILHQKSSSTYLIKIMNGDTSYKSLLEHERQAYMDQSTILYKIMDKYELFHDE